MTDLSAENTAENAGGPWTVEEDSQLETLYNTDLKSVMEISSIHRRTPGGIISRLYSKKIIAKRTDVRGYQE